MATIACEARHQEQCIYSPDINWLAQPTVGCRMTLFGGFLERIPFKHNRGMIVGHWAAPPVPLNLAGNDLELVFWVSLTISNFDNCTRLTDGL
jgi:hypothetical protein